MKRTFMVWIGFISIVAQKLPRKAKVALGCWYYKVAQKLLHTIYLCLMAIPMTKVLGRRLQVKE